MPDDKARLSISQKIARQMEKRGSTTELVNQTWAAPEMKRRALNRANDTAATAYFRSDLSYIVMENETDFVVQIGDRNYPRWKPDASIADPPQRESGK